MVFKTWFLGLEISTLGPGKFLDMVFRTWFSRLGISTLGPGFSHRGFRVAFGHGHPLVFLKTHIERYNEKIIKRQRIKE
jgi:hypothetical protein